MAEAKSKPKYERLDRSRLKDAGEVRPPWNGAMYTDPLDGHRFYDRHLRLMKMQNGEPVPYEDDDEEENPVQVRPPMRGEKGATLPRVVDRRKRTKAQAAKAGPDRRNDKQAGQPASMVQVDLAGWASGDIEVPWSEVRTAIHSRWATMAPNEEEAVRVLIRENIIQPEDVRVVDLHLDDEADDDE